MVKAKLNNEMRYLLDVKYKIFNIEIEKKKLIIEEFKYTNFNKGFGEGVKFLTNEKYKSNFIHNNDFIKKGNYNDISPNKDNKFNSLIKNDNFIGRKEEMMYLIDSILNLKKNIIIYGNKKIGKTQLALEFSYNLYKNNYFKDGNFYFDFKKLLNENETSDITKIIKNEFKINNDLEFDNFFKNKNMLIILDNFDIIKSKNNLIYPNNLIEILVKNNINLILINEFKQSFDNNKYDFNYLEIKKLSNKSTFFYLQLKLLFKYEIALLYEDQFIDKILENKFFNKDYSPNQLNTKETQNYFFKEILKIDVKRKKILK